MSSRLHSRQSSFMGFVDCRVLMGPIGLLGMVVLTLGGCASSGSTVADSEFLGNLQLSPAYSQWLVGPLAQVASEEEIQEFLGLSDDFAAVDFIEAFWARRDNDRQTPGNPFRQAFEARAKAADSKLTESGYLGRRTARGTILVLYGSPESVEFDTDPNIKGPPIEVWTYPAEAKPGLDGRTPQAQYRFRRDGDLTKLIGPIRRRR